MQAKLLDSAAVIAAKANLPNIRSGLTTTGDIWTVREGRTIVILAEPWMWMKQCLACFGPAAIVAAVFDGDPSMMARAAVEIELPKRAGERPKLISYSVPQRFAYRFDDVKLPRANIDIQDAIQLPAAKGRKLQRPGRSKIAEHAS